MPVITFDDFAGGLDVRPLQYMSRPNILRTLLNAYVTTGKTIKKRPCLQSVATLEAGTVGLKSFNGKLQTFYGQARRSCTRTRSSMRTACRSGTPAPTR
jgi:hypothetical protein